MADIACMALGVLCGLLAVGLFLALSKSRRLETALKEERRKLQGQLANNQALRCAQERLQQAQRLAGLRAWEWSLEGTPQDWVDSAFRLLSLAGEAEGEPGSLRRVHPEDKRMLKTAIAQSLFKAQPLEVTFRSLRAEGGVRHLRACAQLQRDAGGRPQRILGTVLDVTEFKEAEVRALQAASVDSLTGALTRTRFFELAAQEFERWRRYRHPVAAMMIDVDHFKQLNDAFGHAFGDQVLQDVVKAIGRQLRRSDILGRYGGDEFAVILPNSTLEAGWQTAERLRRAVSEVRAPASGTVVASVSVSIGVVEIGEDPDLEEVLRRADSALYSAKRSGRNSVMKA